MLGPLFIAAILCTVAGIFWPTFHDFAVTRGTDTSVLVYPTLFVIVWSQRRELSELPIRSLWLGLVGLIGAGFVWLVGELSFVRVLTDFAVIAMGPTAVLTILGYRWLLTTIFPLSLLLFAVPFSNPLVPHLVDWTAKFAFMWIQATGVPIYREGAYFLLPSGNWAIAEACAGIRYLNACLMLGLLYAWTMYQSLRKRIAFVAGAVVIGIVGNWIRAFLTIMIAHLSDNRFLRDGHGTFGWFLFAILLFGYCWLGWTLRDKETEDSPVSEPAHDVDRIEPGLLNRSSARQVSAVSAAVVATLVAWPLIKMAIARPQQPRAVQVADIAPHGAWSRADKPSVEWTPELQNPSRVRVQSFEKAGLRVDVFVGIFQNESWTSKLVTTVNQFADSDNRVWSQIDRGNAVTAFAGAPLEVKTGVVIGRGSRIVAWKWYWIDGASTASDARAKLQQILNRVRGRDDTSAWIAVYSKGDASADVATKALEEFMHDMGGSLERALRMTTTQG